MKITPYISPIRTRGGSFYIFPSAAEDLTFTFNTSSSRRFKFSKFALVNIPDIKNEPYLNTLKLQTIPGAYRSVNFSRTNDYNNLFAESFQNYCLNLETLLTARESYQVANAQTVSERVFWKWIKELGGIRWDYSKTSAPKDLADPLRFEEEVDSELYKRVVQYIGEIDFTNNHFNPTNSNTEVYVHIPTEIGRLPKVLFKVLEDENYHFGMTVKRPETKYPLDDEYISGVNYNDIHPAGLDIHAFYDNDSGFGPTLNITSTAIELYRKIIGAADSQTDIDTYYIRDAWWYTHTTEVNCYYTQPDTARDPTNDDLAIYTSRGAAVGVNKNQAATRFRRSRLDAVQIDWDIDSYRQTTPDAYTFQELAAIEGTKDFQFNAILIYYDLYEFADPNVTAPEVNVNDEGQTVGVILPETRVLATNLFGVLFIDNVENNLSEGAGYIPRLTKYRPNDVVKHQGNEYAIKINLKLNTSPYNTGIKVETVISDSNLISMAIYGDALNQMRTIVDSHVTNAIGLEYLKQEFQKLQNLYPSTVAGQITQIMARLTVLEQILGNVNNLNIVSDISDIQNLVIAYRSELLNLLNGNTIDSTLLFDMDFFRSGPGIILDKSRSNQLLISSQRRSYNFSGSPIVSIQQDFSNESSWYIYDVALNPDANYLKIQEENQVPYSPRKNIVLRIDDGNYAWETGQTFRISFGSVYEMDNTFGKYTFTIRTDSLNALNRDNAYSKVIDIINWSTFAQSNNRPIIEVICLDAENMEFTVDILN